LTSPIDKDDFNPGLPIGENECEHCHKITNDVQYLANPYSEDIHGDIVMEWLCDKCFGYFCDYDDI
jgi:hypothetical protein